MKWKWIVYLRKQWLLLLIKLYSFSAFKPQKTMEEIIKNAYTTQLGGNPQCAIASKDLATQQASFVITLNKGLITVYLHVVNQQLTFSISEFKMTNTDAQFLINLTTQLNIIEQEIKPKLNPYFGL